ncbi:MAG: phosphoribosylamine--glycine ligase [Phycisphaerales bacterium]|jgi:phosphoribosylamine--glycine ligase
MAPMTPPTPAESAVRASNTTINVLLIGSGGREHALAAALRRSDGLGELYTDSPSNPGLRALCKPADCWGATGRFNPKDTFPIERFCKEHRIGLVVIGPEDPLAMGLADSLLGVREIAPGAVLSAAARGAHMDTAALERALRAGPLTGGGGLGGIVPSVFGPLKAAAMLEADKAFAKQLMRSASIPTAEARVFTDPSAAKEYLRSRNDGPVIKAAGLAKGKGVILPASLEEGLEAIDRIMIKQEFGDAGRTVLIEERLKGREVSVLALTDGRTIFVLDPCQDHKRLLDGAKGPNTGGMGALCPTRAIDARSMERIEREVLVPTVDALRRDGIEYRGVLYAGIMLTPAGPKVLEFNCRFGDPECQVLMSRFRGNLLAALLACSGGAGAGLGASLDEIEIGMDSGVSVCVVLAAPGYPDSPRAGLVIDGVENAAKIEGVQIFHAGTRTDDTGRLVTAGGRVLNVVARGDTLEQARERAYAAADMIRFEGKQVRRDIGTDIVG